MRVHCISLTFSLKTYPSTTLIVSFAPNSTGISEGFQRDFRGISEGFQRDFRGISDDLLFFRSFLLLHLTEKGQLDILYLRSTSCHQGVSLSSSASSLTCCFFLRIPHGFFHLFHSWASGILHGFQRDGGFQFPRLNCLIIQIQLFFCFICYLNLYKKSTCFKNIQELLS